MGQKLARQITAERERVAALRQLAQGSPLLPRDMLSTLEEFQTALEGLQAAEEEQLHDQSEELVTAHEATETEHRRYQELFDLAPDGYLVTGADGTIREANRAAAVLLHLGPKFLVGKPLADFVAVEDRPAFRSVLGDLRQADRVEEWRARLRPRDRPPFEAAVTIAAARAGDGRLLSLRWLLRDITERKRAEDERVQAQVRQQYLEVALEHEREIVQTLVRGFLGKQPLIPGLDVFTIYHPASQVDRVGGDYFDFIPLSPHRIGMVIGDVCGKGLAAARYTAMAKYMLRAYAREEADPGALLPRLNDALYDEMRGEPIFVTLFYGVLDLEAGALTYANAGHPPPVRYDRASQTCEHLEATGIVLGALPRQEYRQHSLSFEQDALLALMTDGVTDAAPRLEEHGTCAILQDRPAANAEDLAQAIFGRMSEHAGGDLRDDVAIVVARRK